MKLKELLVLAGFQDEYEIINKNTKEKNTYNGLDKIPESYSNMNVIRIYGYDADGYDGLQIFIQ